MTIEMIANWYFAVVLILYVFGWFIGVWLAVTDADDLLDAVVNVIGITFFGFLAALVWPVAGFVGLLYWVTHR